MVILKALNPRSQMLEPHLCDIINSTTGKNCSEASCELEPVNQCKQHHRKELLSGFYFFVNNYSYLVQRSKHDRILLISNKRSRITILIL